MTSAYARARSRGPLRRIGALVTASALAVTGCTTTSHHPAASAKAAHVAATVGTAKPAVAAHAGTAAALAKVHALARQGLPRAYTGANTTDPDDGIKRQQGRFALL